MATWLTQDDVNNYGHDLIDVTQRAALHAVAPELQEIKQQNAVLQQQLAREARRNLDAAVERALPSFRETDRDPRWHRFLLEIDPYTGQVRQQLLNAAIARSDATAVIAFFKGFMREVAIQPSSAHSERTRTASSNRPTYTHSQIGQLYAAHRKGAYAGREAEWARIEADIFRAQREGRVVGAPYLTK
jgi:hypothetical protein